MTATDPETKPKADHRVRLLAIQLAGFAAGGLMLWWCIRLALNEKNREQLSKLADAGVSDLLWLFALTAASIVLNGLIFWLVLRPARHLRARDVIATNAVATMLAYLPLKAGMLSRFVIHNRRDRVPIMTIGAWVIAVALLLLAPVGPIGAVSMWRDSVDATWWIATIGGVALTTTMLVAAGMYLAGPTGLKRMARVARLLPGSVADRVVKSDAFARLHDGFAMVGHPVSAGGATILRLADLGVIAARFVIAGGVLGVTLGWEDAMLMALTYFLVGIFSPFGLLGTRESMTIVVALKLGMSAALTGADGASPLPAMVLLVSASESVVVLTGGFAGGAWLRADRLLLGRSGRGE